MTSSKHWITSCKKDKKIGTNSPKAVFTTSRIVHNRYLLVIYNIREIINAKTVTFADDKLVNH